MATIKEVDGGREVTIEAHSGSVFLEGKGFAYEFDEGVFVHQVRRTVLFRHHPEAAVAHPPLRVSELWTAGLTLGPSVMAN